MTLVEFGKGIVSAFLYRAEMLFLRTRIAIQSALNITEGYQPNAFAEVTGARDRRANRERFEAFSKLLPAGPLTCTDIGCNIGYFTFKMAERGGVCLGLDITRNELNYARGLAVLHNVENVAFLKFEVSSENVQRLPVSDVIICMSVFHHWVRKFGLEEATRIMDGLATKCRFLVFETGQHNEVDTGWAKQLAFMGSDPDAWIKSYLRDRGFLSVATAGQFPTTLSDVVRTLYVARIGPDKSEL